MNIDQIRLRRIIGTSTALFSESRELHTRLRALYDRRRRIEQQFSETTRVGRGDVRPDLIAEREAVLKEIRTLEGEREELNDRMSHAGCLATSARDFARSCGQLPSDLEV